MGRFIFAIRAKTGEWPLAWWAVMLEPGWKVSTAQAVPGPFSAAVQSRAAVIGGAQGPSPLNGQ